MFLFLIKDIYLIMDILKKEIRKRKKRDYVVIKKK